MQLRDAQHGQGWINVLRQGVFVRRDPRLRPGAKIEVAFGGWTETGGYSARLASLAVPEAPQLGAEQDRSMDVGCRVCNDQQHSND